MTSTTSAVLECHTALLTATQMAEADRLTVESGISGALLMENAGRPVAQAIMQRWTPRSVLVLCGPGSNGGAGFVAARRLAEADWPVRVALLVPRVNLRGEAAHHAGLWRGSVEPLTPAALDGAELVVDAIFGAGLSRALEGAAAHTLAEAAARKMTIVAVDVPSGVMGDTGANVGAVPAELTVTCFRKKPGHLLQPGRSLCGELIDAAAVCRRRDPQVFGAAAEVAHCATQQARRAHAVGTDEPSQRRRSGTRRQGWCSLTYIQARMRRVRVRIHLRHAPSAARHIRLANRTIVATRPRPPVTPLPAAWKPFSVAAVLEE